MHGKRDLVRPCQHIDLEIAGAGWNGCEFDGFSFEGADADDPTYAVSISSGGTVNIVKGGGGAPRED